MNWRSFFGLDRYDDKGYWYEQGFRSGMKYAFKEIGNLEKHMREGIDKTDLAYKEGELP